MFSVCYYVRVFFGSNLWTLVKNKFVPLGFYHPFLWVPVTTAWRVLRLRMEERPPIWRVAANKLNKQ